MENLQKAPNGGQESCVSRNEKAPLTRRGSLKDFNVTPTRRAPSIPKALRPHQIEAVDAVFKRLAEGVDKLY